MNTGGARSHGQTTRIRDAAGATGSTARHIRRVAVGPHRNGQRPLARSRQVDDRRLRQLVRRRAVRGPGSPLLDRLRCRLEQDVDRRVGHHGAVTRLHEDADIDRAGAQRFGGREDADDERARRLTRAQETAIRAHDRKAKDDEAERQRRT